MRTGRWIAAAIIAMIAPPALPATSSVAARQHGSYAVLKADGTVLTWGNAPIGDGTSNSTIYPKQVFVNAIAVSAGYSHVLALRNDGIVWSWGLNPQGQLGDGTQLDRLSPVIVHGLSEVVAVSAGQCHSLALDKNGNVSAWGNNVGGAVGDGTGTGFRTTPVSVSGVSGVVAIAAGQCSSAALKSDGSVWTWGNNFFGQLGDGTLTPRMAPVRVSGLTGIRAIATSGIHMLALRFDGTVWAWGNNAFGQLGDGTQTTFEATPVRVAGLANVVAISAGLQTSYAVTADGSVWVWGDNLAGSFGNGTSLEVTSPTPFKLANFSNVSVISGGNGNVLALKNDGSVWTWGEVTVLTPTAVRGVGGSGTLNLGTSTSILAVAPIESGFNANYGGTFVSVTAVATFRAQDVGEHIYLFAYAPSALVKSAKDGPCVLAALTPTGLQSVSSSSALASTQNVSGANQQAISLLNNVSESTVAGASLCLGVGSTATEATSQGQYVCPATVPGNGGTVCEPPDTIAPPQNLGPTGGVVAKTLGSRATVSSAATLFGGFELSGAATVYILVRGNSLGTLGITQNYLDAPRVRLYNAQGQDLISDSNGAGFNGCASGAFNGAPVVSYYTNVRGIPAHPRDGCTSQSLAAGAYTFTVTPSTAGTTSLPSSGQVLFEVTLGAGSGTITKTLGSRATVTSSATLYGGFETGSASNVYILVRGNSLGTLGITQSFLDTPRVRLFNAAGQDLIISSPSAGPGGLGFNACDPSVASQLPVLSYYSTVRGVPAASHDGCIAQNLTPGAYTFSVTPSIPGVTSVNALSSPSSGQVLFEVTLQ